MSSATTRTFTVEQANRMLPLVRRIVRDIVERHGGSIMCESGEGQGSTFTVTLPAEGPPPSF